MNHLFAKLVLWFCKLLAAVFLVATNAMNPVQAGPEKLVWQTVLIRTEPALTQPSAATQASLVSACGGEPPKALQMPLVPPAVQQIGSFPLDDYGTAVAWSPNGELLATSETFGRIIKIWSFPGLR